MKQNETELSLKVLQKNGLIIRVNLRGLRDNHKPLNSQKYADRIFTRFKGIIQKKMGAGTFPYSHY